MTTAGRVFPMEEPTVNNTPGYQRVQGLHETNLWRDAGIRIREWGGKFLIIANDDIFPPPKPWDAPFSLTAVDLFGYVEECRQMWKQALLEDDEAFDVRDKAGRR